MCSLIRTIATTAMLVAFASPGWTQVSVDVRIGQPPPPPRAYRIPPQPGPDYVWVEGYWTRPPYEGAYWVAPYYEGGRYHAGRWEGERGNVMHNHRWDRDRRRDERREPRREERRGRGR